MIICYHKIEVNIVRKHRKNVTNNCRFAQKRTWSLQQVARNVYGKPQITLTIHKCDYKISDTSTQKGAALMTPNYDQLTILRIAKCYYLDGLSQQEIADKENIHRSQISRILKLARELGYVQIRICSPESVTADALAIYEGLRRRIDAVLLLVRVSFLARCKPPVVDRVAVLFEQPLRFHPIGTDMLVHHHARQSCGLSIVHGRSPLAQARLQLV